MPEAATALVVDADERTCESIRRALLARHPQVLSANDLSGAVELLLSSERLDLIVLDVTNIERGVELAAVAYLRVPTPVVVCTHAGISTHEAFELGRSGVRHLFAKPFTTDELVRALERDATDDVAPPIWPWVAPFVGRMGLFELEHDVRDAMVLQAVASSGENRKAAARLLRAPRPVIQRAAPPRMRRR